MRKEIYIELCITMTFYKSQDITPPKSEKISYRMEEILVDHVLEKNIVFETHKQCKKYKNPILKWAKYLSSFL